MIFHSDFGYARFSCTRFSYERFSFLLKKRVFLVSILLVVSFLFQCQSTKNIQASRPQKFSVLETRSDYQTFLNQYPAWQLQGRIGITFPYEGRRKAVSANIDWQQNKNERQRRRLRRSPG